MVWDAVLVPVLAQNRFSMMTGLFVASSRPLTMELGLWGRQGLHQSRPRQRKSKAPNQMQSEPKHP